MTVTVGTEAVMYDPKSMDSNEFISHDEIVETLSLAKNEARDPERVRAILEKAAEFKGLTHREAAVLFEVEDPDILSEMFSLAKKIKEHIYGRRIVLFAPLYLSDFCVNRCSYCGYNHDHAMTRRKLTQQEVREEVQVLERMGHKRLALETGEDPVNCPLEYVLECIKTIYDLKLDNGAIRRVNVNIAATTVENYRRLKDAGIGNLFLLVPGKKIKFEPSWQGLYPYAAPVIFDGLNSDKTGLAIGHALASITGQQLKERK